MGSKTGALADVPLDRNFLQKVFRCSATSAKKKLRFLILGPTSRNEGTFGKTAPLQNRPLFPLKERETLGPKISLQNFNFQARMQISSEPPPPLFLFVGGIQRSIWKFSSDIEVFKRDLSGTKSRIARFPESRAWNGQKFRSEKQRNESNRSKVEFAENRFRTAIQIASSHCFKRPWNRMI